ncbi:hypothetical protein [Chryseobacterium herbae]|uniref:Uncharacterized protein n=1 Tax=Chryseobacterium herbae TaxID=2976476 RepID=A0ABT2ISH6_9FLAO|nr:hypothetical protein [Chryseobacterium sp. pc1-10]MCT2561784.1 hypothetical protein [Chryseobacterium sp. pc1-10]
MKEILELLGVDKRVQDISLGNIHLFREYSGWESYGSDEVNSKRNHPHPPLFIPIIIDYDATPISFGITKHWFTDREMCYSYMDFAAQFENAEIARTSDQLIDRLIFEYFVDVIEGDEIDVNSKLTVLKKLAAEYSFEDIKRISRLNSTEQVQILASFKEKEPLWLYSNSNINEYTGSFPSTVDLINVNGLSSGAYFEISHKEWIGYFSEKKGFSFFRKQQKYKPLENIPQWLRPNSDKSELFEEYMGKREFNKAWLIINGPGFNPIEVGERLQRLKKVSQDKAYHLWADLWCAKYGRMDSFIFI